MQFLDTYASKNHTNKCNDNEATFSCKTYEMKDGSKKQAGHYGFRAHIICDAKYGLPIKSKVTPANNSEQTELDNLLKEMQKNEYPAKTIITATDIMNMKPIFSKDEFVYYF